MRRFVVVVGVFLVGLVTAGGDCAAPADPRVPCNSNEDCPGTTLCLVDNFCGDPAVNCSEDEDCPPGLICLENGRCRANAECEVDADCCADAAGCASTCTEFRCVGTECEVGETEDCFVGCHRGARSCDNGNWSLCDALPVVAAEVCGDNEDNDCNGQREEGCVECTAPETRECETPCGLGTQDCQGDGTFGACDTVDGCVCDPAVDTARTVPCGFCGFRDSSCGADGFWADDPVCQSEGECAVDNVEDKQCGCGTQSRTCDDTCTWGALSACVVPVDACTPDATETASCGTCGSQTRTCGDDCRFAAPTACVEGSVCAAGAPEVQACGRCGEKTATCDPDGCGFGPFGACVGEGTCTPNEVQTRACGDCGTQSRTCTSACEFGAFGACVDEGDCSPGDEIVEECGPGTETGICEQGTRTFVCDDLCRFPAAFCEGARFASGEICGNGIDEDCNGADRTQPDSFEFNDTCSTAFSLGSDPDGRVLQPTFDSVDDDIDDYFFFNGIDNAGAFSEVVTATVTNMPAGMDLDLFLYKGFNNCLNGAAIDSSQSTGSSESVSFEESFGTEDGDTFYVRVKNFSAAASCFQPYTLTVTGLR
ncbi:MAG: hypothetical protein Q8O67_22795 [Deltaproteobacteria bacterium]|nr:hypothetical protein [Deltaproteobacteria bacterium]